MVYFYYRFKDFLIDLKNFIIKLFYGFGWDDVWNFDIGFMKRLKRMLVKSLKNKKCSFDSTTIDYIDFIYILDKILSDDSFSWDCKYSKNDIKDVDILKLLEIYGENLNKYISEKDFKKLAKFSYECLDFWLQRKTTGYPYTMTKEKWDSYLIQYKDMWNTLLHNPDKYDKELMRRFFKHLPSMWD